MIKLNCRVPCSDSRDREEWYELIPLHQQPSIDSSPPAAVGGTTFSLRSLTCTLTA